MVVVSLHTVNLEYVRSIEGLDFRIFVNVRNVEAPTGQDALRKIAETAERILNEELQVDGVNCVHSQSSHQGARDAAHIQPEIE